MMHQNKNKNIVKDVDEDEEVDKKTIDEKIDYLDKSTILSIEAKNYENGVFLITEKNIKEVNEKGQNVKYSYDPKIRQKVTQLSPDDLIDYDKNPPVLNKEFEDKNIAVCDRNGKVKFYGKVKVQDYLIAGTTFQGLAPNKQGCIYENGKLSYKGYFYNGNKTQGVIYKEGYDEKKDIDDKYNDEQTFLYDHKGEQEYEVHSGKDLLISCENLYLDKDIGKTYEKQYQNVIRLNIKDNNIFKEKGEYLSGNIENIKVQIDNGYRHDFNEKYNDFLDKNGNKIKYNEDMKKKMSSNFDSIISKINEVLSKNPYVKNIEIQGITNFGFLKDNLKEKLELLEPLEEQEDETEEEKKAREIKNREIEAENEARKRENNAREYENKLSLNDKISNYLRKFAYYNNVKIFFSYPKEDSFITSVENDNLNQEQDKQNISNNMVYVQYNPEDNTYIEYENEEEYNKAMEENGYFNNVKIENLTEENTQSHNILVNIDDLKNNDLDKYIKESTIKHKEQELEEKNKEYEDKNKDEKFVEDNEKIKKNNDKTEKQNTTFTNFEIGLIILAGIILFIIGAIITYFAIKSLKEKNKEEQLDTESDIADNKTEYSENPEEDKEEKNLEQDNNANNDEYNKIPRGTFNKVQTNLTDNNKKTTKQI